MDQKKSPSGKGRKKKSEIEAKYEPAKVQKSPEKEFVEGSGIPKDQIKEGFKLMAASFDGKWYQGRIVEVDGNDNTFLVHFDFWNSRFDEWYKFTTKKVKPMEEEPYSRTKHTLIFTIGDTVLAKWIDGKHYRGKVDKVKAKDKYDVVFEDGVLYSTTVDMLKIGDKIDPNLEVERCAKRQEQFQRSRERETRSMRRSLEPGSTLTPFSSTLQDVHAITSVKYLSKMPRDLALTVSLPIKKVSLSYQTKLNANTFASHGTVFNVPDAALVFGSEDNSVRPNSPELKAVEELSPRKRGRPKIRDTPTPTKHFKSDFSPKSMSPIKKTPNKTPSKPPNARSPERSEEKSTPKPKKTSPTKCTVSVQTDPISELTEHTTPLNSARVDQIQLRPQPPATHQATPPLLQTETVLTSDGRWITIATPPTNQQPSDLMPRPPAPNFYYQLVPMGANGPIQQAPPPLPIPIPSTQPQDPVQSLQQPLVLAQPHNPVMVLPQGQTLVQQPQARTLLQPSYIQQQRPMMQFQATNAGILQTQPASAVLVHANTVPNVQQHVVLPQQQSVAAQASLVTVVPTPPQNPIIPTATSDLGASPPVAQRQSDPPSALQLTGTVPLPVSPGPITSPNSSQAPFPPVHSNLTASRATIRFPGVQATVSKETAPPIPGEQTENGSLDTSSRSSLSMNSRMPFSTLLSNAKQPLLSSSVALGPGGSSVGERGDVPIATIFAPPPSDSSLPHSTPHPNQDPISSLPPIHNQTGTPVNLLSQDNNSNRTNIRIQYDQTNLSSKEST